jgi:sugar phosphate isomerase/epimerase
MKLANSPDASHLTYCTNIHPGETWEEVFASLRAHLPEIRANVMSAGPFGIGLRLSAIAAADLAAPDELASFKAFLAAENAYVFTINGFPYGQFHGVRVKENVYGPDWASDDRIEYTNRLAQILAALLPQGEEGSISTVPGTFAAWADGRVDAIVENLVSHVAYLDALHAQTGRLIRLALEPEPCCFLETIDETVRFFTEHLHSQRSAEILAGITNHPVEHAAKLLQTHLGVCYDVCHAAIEYEDPEGSIAALRANSIGIYKLQLSSALRVARVDERTPQLLAPFDEPTYLHQVVGRQDGTLRKWLDLPAALADIDTAHGSEWRVHFHVPIFLDRMQDFDTTQFFLRDILALHRKSPISRHLEVETYTWDVLPQDYRGVTVGQAIARELNWVQEALDR